MTTNQIPTAAVHDLSKRFGIVQAVKGVSIEFHAGEICALMGENGAGKSTLMRMLEGEHQPDTGYIEVLGERVHMRSAREAHACGIRIIHQEPEIIPELTVAENIFIGDFKPKAGLFIDEGDLFSRARALINSLGIGNVLSAEATCQNLGPAQRQLIEIMRALRPGAKLLAFDEPTSSLTEDEAGNLFAMINKLKAEGVAIIYISHRMKEVMDLADRCVVLRDGQKVGDLPRAELDEDQLIRLMVGRPVTDLFNRCKRDLGEVRLSLQGVSTRSVKDISFSVQAGEIVGLGGLIGSGRTEVARAVVGVDPLTSGKMTVSGKDYTPSTAADAIKVGIGLVPEDRKQEGLLLTQSIRENVSLVIADRISAWGFVNGTREKEIVDRHVAELRVKTPSIAQAVGKLSGGNQQKVVFARWQARGPGVLILDEPTRGIDVGAKAEIYRLIESLADEGMAIILISSEMPELLGLSDRIIVMQQGRISGELDGATATEEAVLNLAMSQNLKEIRA